jgi:hypothetical protein
MSTSAEQATGADATAWGLVTVDDLEGRAERARRIYLDTYTATSVLHDLYMTADDPELRDVLDSVFARIKRYRAVRRKEWIARHRVWAEAVGIEPLHDDTNPEETAPDAPGEDLEPDAET